MKVAIIGMGVIGSAQAEMFAGHELVTYDPATDDTYPADALACCDFALVCVGTPRGEFGRADLNYVEAATEALPAGLPVALRSTVPPGTTDRVFERTGRLYCHAPEFMGENVLHSWQRSTDVPYMIIGGNPESTLFFKTAFTQVFPRPDPRVLREGIRTREVRSQPVLGGPGHVHQRARPDLRPVRRRLRERPGRVADRPAYDERLHPTRRVSARVRRPVLAEGSRRAHLRKH